MTNPTREEEKTLSHLKEERWNVGERDEHRLSPLLCYSIAILSTGGALALTLLMERAQLGPSTRLLFLAAVVVSSWYGGLGPGLLATLLSAVGSIYFFHDIQRLSLPTNFSTVRFTEFLIVALLVSVLNAARQRAQRRADEARRTAEDANRTKDDFLAAVTHDLRTPLTSILGWTRILHEQKLDEPTSARALAAIERNAEAQEDLIKDLLDVSRIAAGKMRLEMRPVDLIAVFNAACDVVRPTAEAKRIYLRAALETSTCMVSGDTDRLQQVMWNLLSNAIKFTPEGGRVEAGLECADGFARITVTDTGCGIAPEFLPHVFERFRQAQGARSHRGLGLGLSIVRNFIELHGGTVHAASDGEGRGATFTVTLPLMHDYES